MELYLIQHQFLHQKLSLIHVFVCIRNHRTSVPFSFDVKYLLRLKKTNTLKIDNTRTINTISVLFDYPHTLDDYTYKIFEINDKNTFVLRHMKLRSLYF